MNRRTFLAAMAAMAACRTKARCGGLTAADVDQGISLGGLYLATSLTAQDDFIYEVDWEREMAGHDKDGVRQAGAAFGLCDHAARTGEAAMLAAADRAIRTWTRRQRITPNGTTVVYGKTGLSRMGTTALVGLGCLARGTRPGAAPEVTGIVDGILDFVRNTRAPGGGFHEKYDVDTDTKDPETSPYADGEALLFLTTLAVKHGRKELIPQILQWAEEDWVRNVEQPLARETDPPTTKGYYQWGSMSWANLVEGGHEVEKWGGRLTDLATWMVDVHHTLERSKNTAYAYEGIIPAYVEARRRGERALADHLACTIHTGLAKLCSWQIGHARALPQLAKAKAAYKGGVQNHAEERWLRIDVTQHQLHALWLAKESGVTEHVF